MPTLQEILRDPNYINANPATKKAIFERWAPSDQNYSGANQATQAAIRQRFGVESFEPVAEPAPEEKGFFSNLGSLLVEGGERAIGAAKVSPSVISGDVGKEQAGVISEQLGMKPSAQPKELKEVTTAFRDEAQALERAKGFTESVGPVLGFMAEFGKQALTNPKGVAYLTAQSAANMAPSIAGMIAGGKLGAMAGTAVAPGPGTAIGGVSGAIAGGFAGSAPMEIGSEFIDNVGKELQARKLPPTKENVEALLADRAFVEKAISEARTKGTTTAAVDAAMTAGAGRFATGTRRAAIKAAQEELGAAADAAKIASRAEEILKQGTMAQRAGRAVKRGAGAVGIDVAGGGLSEAAGQYAAYGEVDPESVALEMLGELGGAGIEVPSAAYATSRDLLREKAKRDAAAILEEEGAVEPARVQPARAPEEQPLDIEELERQFGMAPAAEPATPTVQPAVVEPAAAEEPAKTEAGTYVSPLESIRQREEPAPEVAAETPAVEETPQQRYERLSRKQGAVINAFRERRITNQEYEKFQADLEAARLAARGAPVDLSTLSEAKQEILRLADEIEASGNAPFAQGMRRNATPEAREPTADMMEFYRSKLPTKKEAPEAAAPVEQVAYGLPEFFSDTPKDADRIAGLRKSGPTKVRVALDEINDTIQRLADTITAAGYKMENVKAGAVPPGILRIKSQIGQLAAGADRLARSAEAIQKGYKRADKKRLQSDIASALQDIEAAEDLISLEPNLPPVAEQMEGKPVPPSPEVQDLMEQQRKAADDITRLKGRSDSLWTALAGKLTKGEVFALGGRSRKVGENPFLNLGAKRGKPTSELSDLVADGLLDDFLPPDMRHDSSRFDEQESTEQIRQKLISGNYFTHATNVEIEKIGQSILDIEQRIQEELSLDEINREIQVAIDEQREADQAVADFAAESEAGAVAQREDEEATELDDLERRATEAGIDVDAIREEVYYDTRGEEDINYERTLADRLRGALSVQEQFLAMQTEEELRAQEQLKAEQEKARKAEEKAAEEKARADEAVSDFVLTGSERAADQAAARGQMELVPAEEPKTYLAAIQSAGFQKIPRGNERAYKDASGKEYTTLERDGVRVVLRGSTMLSTDNKGNVEEYSGEGNQWTLQAVLVDPNKRGQGLASQAIRDITDLASQYGIDLYLQPTPIEGGPMSAEQLGNFYNQFGFSYMPGKVVMLREAMEAKQPDMEAVLTPENEAAKEAYIKASKEGDAAAEYRFYRTLDMANKTGQTFNVWSTKDGLVTQPFMRDKPENGRLVATIYPQTVLESAEKGQTGYNPDPEEQRVEQELTGKTMIQAADWAVQNAPNAFARVIAEKVRNRLRDLQRKGVELEFKIEGGNTRTIRMSRARGLTTATYGEKELGTKTKYSITLNGAAVVNNQAGYPPGTRYQTVLHELIHVATMGQLQFTPFSDPIRKQLRELSNIIVDRFNEDAKANRLPPVMQRYYVRDNNALQNDDEVLAWGLTDGEVQKYFADIKVGEKSLMTRLVELVRDILGLGKPYESALDRLVRTTESLLDADVETIEAVLGKSGRTLGGARPTTGEQQTLFQKEIDKTLAGWTDERIDKLINTYGYNDGRTYGIAAYVDPAEFVLATTPTKEAADLLSEEAGELDIEKIKAETQTPFLDLDDEKGVIVGHEGRHRMAALARAGVRRAPVVLYMKDRYGGKKPDMYEAAFVRKMKGQSFQGGMGASIFAEDLIPINYLNKGALQDQFGEGNIRYQQEGQTAQGRRNIYGEIVLGNWTEPNDTKLAGELGKDDIIYWLQDKMVDTKRVVQAITQTTGKIATRWNPYLQEELYHGRTAKETNDFLAKELRPLMQEMQSKGVTIGDFEQYLHNRHAEAYNAQVAKVNPDDADMQDGGSGITNQEARDYLDSLPQDKRKVYESLAKKLDGITKGTRDLLVKSGLESKETIEAWENAFPDYVPLHREDVDFQYTTSSTGTGQGFDVRGPFSRRAMGSKRKVVDILANIAMQRERAIVKANKNRVAEAVYGLAVQNPNPDFWLAINPMAEKVPEAAIEELKSMGIDEEAANFLMKEPTQRAVDPKKNEVVNRINAMLRNNDNVLSMRYKGENRYVFFNPNNERAARAAKALKNLDAEQLSQVMGIIARVTRWMASVNTQYNPIFGAYNFLRDVQGAALQLSDTPLAGKQKEVTVNVLPALKAIYSSLRKTRRGEEVDTEMAKLWDDFQKAGGQTGFRDMFSRSQERAEALQKEFAQMTEGKIKSAGRATLQWLSDYNDTMENAVRLAAYKVALDSGMNREEAASVAKNLTVNFNKKGQVALQAGALYAFFNAAVQGTTRLAQTLKGPAGRKIIAGGLLLGGMQALLLAAAGFDDEEPPEFVRERNIIIPIGGNKYIAFPMPLGYHVIPGTSRILTEWALSGFKDTAERIVSLTGMYLEAFNPIGNAGWSAQTLTPTFLDPIVALTENKDWTGKPIARKDFSNLDPTPGYTRAKDAATWYSTKIAQFLNFASGGTKYQPGVISPTPDQIDYLIGQATGGIGREIGKAATTIEKTITGEELPSYKIPLVGRFYGETKSSAAEANRFYKNLEHVNKLENEIKGRRENKEPLGDFISQNPEARLAKRGRDIYNDIKKLRERREKLVERKASRESVKVVEDQITNKMRTFNEQVARLKD